MEPNSNSSWRSSWPEDYRQKIVKRITDTLQRDTPPTSPESMGELRKIACGFEEQIFHAASDKEEYLRKISFKMLEVATNFQAAQATPVSQVRLGSRAGIVQSLDPGVTIGATLKPTAQRVAMQHRHDQQQQVCH